MYSANLLFLSSLSHLTEYIATKLCEFINHSQIGREYGKRFFELSGVEKFHSDKHYTKVPSINPTCHPSEAGRWYGVAPSPTIW